MLVALVLTVPAYGQGGSGTDGADDATTSYFGLVHRAGDSEATLAVYKVGMAVCIVLVIVCVILDTRSRRARRRSSVARS